MTVQDSLICLERSTSQVTSCNAEKIKSYGRFVVLWKWEKKFQLFFYMLNRILFYSIYWLHQVIITNSWPSHKQIHILVIYKSTGSWFNDVGFISRLLIHAEFSWPWRQYKNWWKQSQDHYKDNTFRDCNLWIFNLCLMDVSVKLLSSISSPWSCLIKKESRDLFVLK